MITFYIVEDHTIVRQGLKQLLAKYAEMKVLAEFGVPDQIMDNLAKGERPDIVLCDINLPGMDGLALTEKIKQKYPDQKIIILTMHQKEFYVLKAFDAGADGYFHKDTEESELIMGIKKIYNGQKYFCQSVSQILINRLLDTKNSSGKTLLPTLTFREKEVLEQVVAGLGNREIGDKLCISTRTVENHRANILRKFGLKNTVELVKFAIENSLV
ncbi:response regulator [Microscilla marina]|uniref:Two-component response regulator n=1 Tax=Microscilla marina ATCC 23134 TaxID=313606 RepID=A1ZEE6_MICM2|nr:response regulator transcription factor [Microscilla marina]EAY31454.1 two-component response regulator [Microscilla marina ATCC 23134]